MNNQVNNLNKYVKLNPNTTKYIIISLVVLCLILFLVFADFSVSVGSTKKQTIRSSALSNKQINKSNNILQNNRTNLVDSRINMHRLGKNNINDALGAPYAFPPIDRYMSHDLREQIKGLKDKFYYDNCKYGSLL